MNADKTIKTKAVVAANCAIARRSHTNSQRMLQNPETRKKPKYQRTRSPVF